MKLSKTALFEIFDLVRCLPLPGLKVPEITLHVSPYRLTQLLLVMRVLVPENATAVDPAPWVKAAEYTSNVEILTWQGLVAASSEWQQRYAVVYRGTLYFMHSEGSPFIMRQVALWQGRRALPLPEDITGRDPPIRRQSPDATNTHTYTHRCTPTATHTCL